LVPEELVRRAARSGVRVLALTDHDTTSGLAAAREAAVVAGLELVPGVEVSVTWCSQTVHVLGLRIDPANGALQRGLTRLREFRDWRAEEIGRRLADHGIPGAYQGAKAFCAGSLIGRTHFARYLVLKKIAKDERRVFQHFLVRGKPGHVPGNWADLGEAVSWIRSAGGWPVIAHPARYRFTRSKLRRLIGEFVEAGGSALEVVSGSHSRDDCFVMARHAREFRMLGSAGSDFHGPENPWIELGRLPGLPEGCEPLWRHWGVDGEVERSVA
jgi:predicted metal-dependent phosphoesterase TrpH